MNLFTIDNNKLVYSPEALAIKEFKALWERDKSKNKEFAVEDLAYIYYLTDYKSIYKAYDLDVRKDKIKNDVISQTKWSEDKFILDAIERYEELQQTPSMGMLKDAEAAVDKIREYFRSVDVSQDESGRATTALINNVKAVGELIKGMATLKDIVSKEMTENVKMKGQGRLGMREKPR